MKTKKRTEKKYKAGSKRIWIGILVLACFAVGGASVFSHNQNKESKLLAQIESYQGYIRVVSQEEKDFYSAFVKRELSKDVSEEELEVLTLEYMNEVNAVFLLGNELGLCEPYSFELLKLRMEQENRNRQLKKEQGEVIYGVEQFTLETFYQYERDLLESDIIAYLEANIDQGIVKLAKDFYDENEVLFMGRLAVVYEETKDGNTKEVEADREQLDFLGNADRGLADFLETGGIGEVYQDQMDGADRTVLLKDIKYTKSGFENNKENVLTYYIRNILFEDLIDMVASQNPVELF